MQQVCEADGVAKMPLQKKIAIRTQNAVPVVLSGEGRNTTVRANSSQFVATSLILRALQIVLARS